MALSTYANNFQIKKATEQVSLEKSFRNLRINEIAHLFKKTIKKVL